MKLIYFTLFALLFYYADAYGCNCNTILCDMNCWSNCGPCCGKCTLVGPKRIERGSDAANTTDYYEPDLIESYSQKVGGNDIDIDFMFPKYMTPSSSKSLSSGGITGIVIGGIVFIILLAVIGVVIFKRRQSRFLYL